MSALRIVTVGPLSWEMGIEYALLAVARLRERGIEVRYDIVGTGPERDRVLYTAFDLGLGDVVTLHADGATVAADVLLWPHLLSAPPPATDMRIVGPGLNVRDPGAIAEALA